MSSHCLITECEETNRKAMLAILDLIYEVDPILREYAWKRLRKGRHKRKDVVGVGAWCLDAPYSVINDYLYGDCNE